MSLYENKIINELIPIIEQSMSRQNAARYSQTSRRHSVMLQPSLAKRKSNLEIQRKFVPLWRSAVERKKVYDYFEKMGDLSAICYVMFEFFDDENESVRNSWETSGRHLPTHNIEYLKMVLGFKYFTRVLGLVNNNIDTDYETRLNENPEIKRKFKHFLLSNKLALIFVLRHYWSIPSTHLPLPIHDESNIRKIDRGILNRKLVQDVSDMIVREREKLGRLQNLRTEFKQLMIQRHSVNPAWRPSFSKNWNTSLKQLEAQVHHYRGLSPRR